MSFVKRVVTGSSILSALALCSVATANTHTAKLDLNDVSWLWPAPHTEEDLSNIIAISDLKSNLHSKTDSVGGTGGSSFDIQCAAGSVLVGVSGRSGTLIDQVQALCVSVDSTGHWVGSPATTDGPMGGNGGLSFLQQCPADHAMVGFSASEENGVARFIQAQCRSLVDARTTNGDIVNLTGAGGSSSGAVSHSCPDTGVATGIHGRSGALVDSFGLGCVEGQSVWSDTHFQDLLKAIDGGLTEVNGNQVQFGPEIRDKSVWRVAAMRVDPCAPGCSVVPSPIGKQQTQIRLIVQPVTNGVVVHDVAVHLIYSWMKDATNRDDDKFREILAGLDALKIKSAEIGAPTSGKPLSVHPGLRARNAEFNADVLRFLETQLAAEKLDAIALMGIQSGIEPWFFLALTKLGDGSFGKIPAPIPSAAPQMIDFRVRGGKVAPTPIVSNRPNGGVSTAPLFGASQPSMEAFAVVGKDSAGNQIFDTELKNKDIPDLVANPLHSHFFNTDCVSCHTETRRRERLSLEQGDFAFKPEGHPPAIADAVTPADDWNVRNFGWFTPHFFIGGGPVVETATQRSANESQEVVEFIERNFRSESLQ